MKNILVTGAQGQLGTELQQLREGLNDAKWFFTDYQQLDITHPQAVKDFILNNEINGIINCAAYTNVDQAETESDKCKSINADAPGYLAEMMQLQNGWMIHVSTDYVFDGKSFLPYTEDDTPNPLNIYGKTKYEGEKKVLANCMNSMIIRTAWLYAPTGNNFVKTMIKLGKERQRISVISDQTGSPTSATCLAQAIIAIIQKGIIPGIYHYSNEGVASWYDFTKAIHRMAGITQCHVDAISTSEYPTTACRPYYTVMDKHKIKETYDLCIPHWQDALEACMNKGII